MLKLLNMDAFEFFNSGVKVDAIITDPPYNISRKNNFTTMSRFGIDFGNWDKDFDQRKWIIECSKMLKDGGSILIFNDWKNMGDICKTLEECGFEVKDLMRWIKNNPMPRNRERRYITDFEQIIWAIKPSSKVKWTFNFDPNLPYHRPEFKYPIVTKNIDKIHPTQKPIELMKELVKIHTNENDLVFDPFMGSGSTGIACKELNRNFIGIEINKEYYDAALLRLDRFEKNDNINQLKGVKERNE